MKPQLADDRPHLLATLFLVLGAFFGGYQLLRIASVNFTLADTFFALAFVICLLRQQITGTPFGGLTPIWLIGLVMMLGGLMVGTAVHGDMIRWIIISCQYLMGFLFLPMLFMRQPLWLARRMVLAFIIGIVVMEVIGIAVSMTMTHEQAAAIFSREFVSGNGRMSTFASEPNWNGAIIALTWPLLIYAQVRRIIPVWAFLVIVPILIWAMLLTASFSGFASCMVAISIPLLFLGSRYLGGALLVVGVAATIFVASGAPLPSVFEKRVGGAISTGDIDKAGTYDGRMKLIAEAWNKIDQTAFVGMGIEGFRKTNDVQQPVHNLYLLMLMDGGLMSFMGIILLAVLMVCIPVGRMRTQRIEAGIALAEVTVFIIFSQSSPHMYSRLIIVPVLFALMILYRSDAAIPQKNYASRHLHTLRRKNFEIANESMHKSI